MLVILEILALLLPFVLEYLGEHKKGKDGRDGDQAIQRARQALAKGDGPAVDAAVADLHDRVSQALRGRAGG